MGGGPSDEQKRAAAAQEEANKQSAQTSKDMLNIYKSQYAKIDPFATQRMNNGLPFFPALTDFARGTSAQAFAPAYASLNQRLNSMGTLPSGFRTAALSDLDASRARSFDQNLVNNLLLNETAKNNAAAMLTGQQQMSNPLGWTQATTQGNQAIMQAPLQSQGVGSIIGGIAGAASKMMPF